MNVVMSKRKISAKRLQAAKIKGIKVYQSATNCPHCDGIERYVSTRSCVVCTKAKNQERKQREIENLPCVLEWHLVHTLKTDNEMSLINRYL